MLYYNEKFNEMIFYRSQLTLRSPQKISNFLFHLSEKTLHCKSADNTLVHIKDPWPEKTLKICRPDFEVLFACSWKRSHPLFYSLSIGREQASKDELECSFKEVTANNDTSGECLEVRLGMGLRPIWGRYSLSYSGQKQDRKDEEKGRCFKGKCCLLLKKKKIQPTHYTKSENFAVCNFE